MHNSVVILIIKYIIINSNIPISIMCCIIDTLNTNNKLSIVITVTANNIINSNGNLSNQFKYIFFPPFFYPQLAIKYIEVAKNPAIEIGNII